MTTLGSFPNGVIYRVLPRLIVGLPLGDQPARSMHCSPHPQEIGDRSGIGDIQMVPEKWNKTR